MFQCPRRFHALFLIAILILSLGVLASPGTVIAEEIISEEFAVVPMEVEETMAQEEANTEQGLDATEQEIVDTEAIPSEQLSDGDDEDISDLNDVVVETGVLDGDAVVEDVDTLANDEGDEIDPDASSILDEGDETEVSEDELLPEEIVTIDDMNLDPLGDEVRLMATDNIALAATSATLNGVDISGWNTLLNISNLDADFVIIKATEWNPDKKNYTSYTTNRSGRYKSYIDQAEAALAAGKLIGFYHFATNPSMGASWTAQAQGFIDAVSGYVGNAVLFLDWEDTSYSTIEGNVSGARQWLDYVYEHTGVMPLIYMNKNCSNSYNWSSVADAGYELWGAEYADMKHHSNYQSSPWQSNRGWGAWGSRPTIFQYSSTTTVTGSGGNIDVNKFYGSRNDWIELAGWVETSEDTSTALTNNAVYSLSALPLGSILVTNSSSNVKLVGSSLYLTGYWLVNNLGDGLYSFTSMYDGRNLSYADNATSGTNINMTGSHDIWRLVKCTNGSYALVPYGLNNLRMSVAGGRKSAAGTNIQLSMKVGKGIAQSFFFTRHFSMSDAANRGVELEEGVYTVTNEASPSMVIAIAGGSTANCGNVILYSSVNSISQRFEFIPFGNGLFKIRSIRSGKFLSISASSKSSGANVIQYENTNKLGQIWYFRSDGDALVIISAYSGMAINLNGNSTANNTNIQVLSPRSFSNNPGQAFLVSRSEALSEAVGHGKDLLNGFYVFKSGLNQSLVACVVGRSSADKANIVLGSSSGDMSQKFELTYQGCGLYTIRSTSSGKQFAVINDDGTGNANVVQRSSNLGVAQFWFFVNDGSGYVIKSALTGGALTVEGGLASSGANVCTAPVDGGTAQNFAVVGSQLIPNGTYAISSILDPSKLTLDIKGNGSSRFVSFACYQPMGVTTQLFTIRYVGGGSYTIQSKEIDLYLGAANTSSTGITLQQSSGSNAQYWRPTITASGGISFVNVGNGQALGVSGGQKYGGVPVRQYNRTGSTAQGWVLVPESSFVPASKLDKLVNYMTYYTSVVNVGYTQGTHRNDLWNGGQCDCSSLIIGCLKRAGFSVGKANSTRDIRKYLTANGWEVVSWSAGSVRTGDILLCDGYHCCAVVSGSGSSARIAEAWLNENGGTHDGRPGDQTGQETRTRKVYQYPYGGGWQCILRYSA